MNIVEGKSIFFKYPNAKNNTLANASFVIPKGKITLFLGKSGSGKTTLLKCIGNIYSDYQGDISFNTKSIRQLPSNERVKSIGFVDQQYNLFPHFSVLENCMHPQVHVLNTSLIDARHLATNMLAHLGIENLASKKPNDLSGGQMQRVAIARALCMNTKVLLLDEPTSALDPESSSQLAELLETLLQDGITVIISTHDMPFAQHFKARHTVSLY